MRSWRTTPISNRTICSPRWNTARDFEVGHLIGGVPKSLLLVTTGNITNGELLSLVIANIELLSDAFENARFIELSSGAVTIRGGAGR